MKKKDIFIGVSCVILLFLGICYSCSYKMDNSSVTLISDLSGDDMISEEGMNAESSDETIHQIADSGQSVDGMKQHIDIEDGAKDAILTAPDNESHTTKIYVHLCGAVIKPGVYQVSDASRIIDLIELAGGLTKEAAGDYINQAQSVTDGQRIYIPSRIEVEGMSLEDYIAPSDLTQTDKVDKNRPININTADAEELMELPGVGEAKAASIIEYRTTNGSFQKIEDLMKIPGIKEGLFNQVSSDITVK